jgi:hypothetical protein
MNKRLVIVLALILPSLLVDAQFRRKRYKYELMLNLGATNFLGDVGGSSQIGTHFVKDFNYQVTKPVGGLGIRYKNNRYWALQGGLWWGQVGGNDAISTEPFRHNRNINFKSIILEPSVRFEGYFTQDRGGHLYRLKNVHGMKRKDIQAYFFGGVGLFYYNPKGEYTNGNWYALRPLGTEGQGLPGGPKEYSPVSICFPLGLGAKIAIDQRWSIGAEYGMRYTLTDYIDDTGGKYYSNSAIKAAHGNIAAYFADPSLMTYPKELGGASAGVWQAAPGQERGNPKYKDAYMFMTLNVNYKIPYKRKRTRSKF